MTLNYKITFKSSRTDSVPVRVPSIGQIELFKPLLYLKRFNCPQKIKCSTKLLVLHSNI